MANDSTSATDWLEISVDADAESVDAVVELFSRHVYNQGVVLSEPLQQGQLSLK